MELWDVYDENRKKTGKIIERGTSWGNKKYHLIVHAAIFDEKGRMLIQHRSPAKRALANLWDLSAGGAVAGEDSRQAAERETWALAKHTSGGRLVQKNRPRGHCP